MSNVGVAILKAQFKSAHDWLENTVGAASNEQLHWQPDGLLSPIGAQYFHVVIVEDFFSNTAAGKTPLMMDSLAGKTGASKMPPQGGSWRDWGKSVEVDLAQAREYAKAVYANTDAILDSLNDGALAQEIDLSSAGFGTMPLYGAFNILILNCYSHTGEISALKGLQGEKGYPI